MIFVAPRCLGVVQDSVLVFEVVLARGVGIPLRSRRSLRCGRTAFVVVQSSRFNIIRVGRRLGCLWSLRDLRLSSQEPTETNWASHKDQDS